MNRKWTQSQLPYKIRNIRTVYPTAHTYKTVIYLSMPGIFNGLDERL